MISEYNQGMGILRSVRGNSVKILTLSCVLFVCNLFSIRHSGYLGIFRLLGCFTIAVLVKRNLKTIQQVSPHITIENNLPIKRPYVVLTNRNSFVPVSSKTPLHQNSVPKVFHINAKPVARKLAFGALQIKN
jgi:hypothetical protein